MIESIDKLDIFVSSAEYKRWFDRCVAFAMSYTCSLSEAENMASEALIALWQKIETGETVNEPLAFAFSVIRNKAFNYLRHQYVLGRSNGKMEEEALDELQRRMEALDACDPHYLYSADVQSILNTTLESLGSKTKDIFLMSRFTDKTNREIAKEIGVSEKSVEYHITKSIRAVKEALKDYLPSFTIVFGS